MDVKEIDRQIAEFMGWTNLVFHDFSQDYENPPGWYGTDPEGNEGVILYMNYSTRPDHAFEVRDKIIEMPYPVRKKFVIELAEAIKRRMGFDVIYPEEIILNMSANDICLAALEAVKGKDK